MPGKSNDVIVTLNRLSPEIDAVTLLGELSLNDLSIKVGKVWVKEGFNFFLEPPGQSDVV